MGPTISTSRPVIEASAQACPRFSRDRAHWQRRASLSRLSAQTPADRPSRLRGEAGADYLRVAHLEHVDSARECRRREASPVRSAITHSAVGAQVARQATIGIARQHPFVVRPGQQRDVRVEPGRQGDPIEGVEFVAGERRAAGLGDGRPGSRVGDRGRRRHWRRGSGRFERPPASSSILSP